jgi:hypothetical protein
MQEIKTQNNEIMVMLDNLQITIYNSDMLQRTASSSKHGTQEDQIPDIHKIIINNDEKDEEPALIVTDAREIIKAKRSKLYSFKREKVARIFKQALEHGLELPRCKRPADVERSSDANYCLYHRVVGHAIEDCWDFKDWVEEGF